MGLSGAGWGARVERPLKRDWPELWAHKGQRLPWLCPGPQTRDRSWRAGLEWGAGSSPGLDTVLILFSLGLSFSTSKMGLISLICYFTRH